jgi:hypothetical protein
VVERHTGLNQRGELPRQERQRRRRYAGTLQRATTFRRRIDGRGRQAIGAQPIANGARSIGIEQSLPQASLRIDRFEAK